MGDVTSVLAAFWDLTLRMALLGATMYVILKHDARRWAKVTLAVLGYGQALFLAWQYATHRPAGLVGELLIWQAGAFIIGVTFALAFWLGGRPGRGLVKQQGHEPGATASRSV